MDIKLHKKATIHADTQSAFSSITDSELARQDGVATEIIWGRRFCDDVYG